MSAHKSLASLGEDKAPPPVGRETLAAADQTGAPENQRGFLEFFNLVVFFFFALMPCESLTTPKSRRLLCVSRKFRINTFFVVPRLGSGEQAGRPRRHLTMGVERYFLNFFLCTDKIDRVLMTFIRSFSLIGVRKQFSEKNRVRSSGTRKKVEDGFTLFQISGSDRRRPPAGYLPPPDDYAVSA